jgi:hypothetical protein
MMNLDASIAAQIVAKHDKDTGSEYCEYASNYGEPGYSDPTGGILLANWNNVPDHVQHGLERRGFELEWSDEWSVHYETANGPAAYRTQPDSYGWTPSLIFLDDGSPFSRNEAQADPDDYLEILLDNPNRADTFGIDWALHGFESIQDGESGFHPGQTDKPETMLAAAQAMPNGADFDYIFQIRDNGQFDIKFRLLRRSNTWEL